MKPRTLFLIGLTALLGAGFTSCRVKPVEVVVPDSAPIVQGLNDTEASTKAGIVELRKLSGAAMATSLGTPQEAKTREITDKLNETLASIEASVTLHPAKVSVDLINALNKAIIQLKAVIKIKDAEIAKLKDANARVWHWVFYGGGTFFAVLSVVSFFGGASIPGVGPLVGPRIAWLAGITSATLYSLGYVYDWTQKHPVYTAIAVTLLIGSIGGLIWANRVQHKLERSKT